MTDFKTKLKHSKNERGRMGGGGRGEGQGEIQTHLRETS